MATSNDVSRGRLLEASHGVQALFEMSMVAFHAIVEILRGTMLNIRQDHTKSWRIALGFVSCDSRWPHPGLIDRAFEESLRCLGIPPLGEVRVNDLAILVDGAIDVGPFPV